MPCQGDSPHRYTPPSCLFDLDPWEDGRRRNSLPVRQLAPCNFLFSHLISPHPHLWLQSFNFYVETIDKDVKQIQDQLSFQWSCTKSTHLSIGNPHRQIPFPLCWLNLNPLVSTACTTYSIFIYLFISTEVSWDTKSNSWKIPPQHLVTCTLQTCNPFIRNIRKMYWLILILSKLHINSVLYQLLSGSDHPLPHSAFSLCTHAPLRFLQHTMMHKSISESRRSPQLMHFVLG